MEENSEKILKNTLEFTMYVKKFAFWFFEIANFNFVLL